MPSHDPSAVGDNLPSGMQAPPTWLALGAAALLLTNAAAILLLWRAYCRRPSKGGDAKDCQRCNDDVHKSAHSVGKTNIASTSQAASDPNALRRVIVEGTPQ